MMTHEEAIIAVAKAICGAEYDITTGPANELSREEVVERDCWEWMAHAKAAVTAYLTARNDMKLVPKEAMEEMLKESCGWTTLYVQYMAMIKAAPEDWK